MKLGANFVDYVRPFVQMWWESGVTNVWLPIETDKEDRRIVIESLGTLPKVVDFMSPYSYRHLSDLTLLNISPYTEMLKATERLLRKEFPDIKATMSIGIDVEDVGSRDFSQPVYYSNWQYYGIGINLTLDYP